MSPGQRRPTVLIADDAVYVAERVAREIAEQCSAHVVGPVGDGRAALSLFGSEKPDVVILDITMPQLTGIEVLRAIRASRRPCAVIMLTEHYEPAILAECWASGADEVLVKADDADRIGDVVRARLMLDAS